MIARKADDRRRPARHAAQTMTKRPPSSGRSRSKGRADFPVIARLEPDRRFARSDGRFDLPVVTGRTPQQVARRLA
jgi:hypothetical protein